MQKDEFVKESAGHADVFGTVSDANAVYADCKTKAALTEKSTQVTKQLQDMKTIMCAFKRALKDVEATKKQFDKAKSRFELQKKKAAGNASAVLQGRPNLTSLKLKDGDPACVRGFKYLGIST